MGVLFIVVVVSVVAAVVAAASDKAVAEKVFDDKHFLTILKRSALGEAISKSSPMHTDLINESRYWFRSAVSHIAYDFPKLVAKVNKRAEAILSTRTSAPNIHHDPTLLSHSSSSDLGSRIPLLVRLAEGCDYSCFNNIQANFLNEDPYFSSSWVRQDVVLVTSTFNAFYKVCSTYNNDIIGLIPYESDYKIEKALFDLLYVQNNAVAALYDGSAVKPKENYAADNIADCKSYIARIAILSIEELKDLKSRLIEMGSMSHSRFAVSFEGATPGKSFSVIIQVSPSKVVNADGTSVYACDPSIDQVVISKLAELPEVIYIDQFVNPVTSNRWSKGLCQTGDESKKPLYDSGYRINGTGQIIGVSDTGLDMMNCYFYDPDVNLKYRTINHNHRKVVYYYDYADKYDDDVEGHGTHVSGSVAGYSYLNYGDFKNFNGVAWGAKIAFYDIGDSKGDLKIPVSTIDTDLFQKLYNAGARIFTNSWVQENINYYNDLSKRIDDWMFTHPDALVIFSNGNSGDNGANTAWAPGTFKNGMSVGAASNDHKVWLGLTYGQATSEFKSSSMMTFSSQGPTEDGRMKPDISAPGSFIMSADGNFNVSKMHCDIIEMQGTSMAAPTAAGATALVREYFVRGFFPSGNADDSDSLIPSGALLKAMMIASGTKMERVIQSKGDGTTSVDYPLNDYPGNIQGYGTIDLSNVLNFDAPCRRDPLTLFVKGAASNSDVNNYVEIASNSMHSYLVKVSAGTKRIRAVLTYNDVPVTAHIPSPVFNALVLTIEQTGSASQTFSAYTTGTSQSNVFMIDVPNPVAGDSYTVKVSSGALQTNGLTGLPYALVVTGSVNQANATSSDNYDDNNILNNLEALTETNLSSGMIKTVAVLGAVAAALFSVAVALKLAIRSILSRWKEENKKLKEIEGDPEERDALALAQAQQIELQRQEYEEIQRQEYLRIQQEHQNKARRGGASGGEQRARTAPSTPHAESPSSYRAVSRQEM